MVCLAMRVVKEAVRLVYPVVWWRDESRLEKDDPVSFYSNLDLYHFENPPGFFLFTSSHPESIIS